MYIARSCNVVAKITAQLAPLNAFKPWNSDVIVNINCHIFSATMSHHEIRVEAKRCIYNYLNY